MKKEIKEEILNNLLSTGADFAEVYEEKETSKNYVYLDSKLDNIDYCESEGVGLRIAKDDEIFYASSSSRDKDDILSLADSLKSNVNGKVIYNDVKLNKEERFTQEVNNNGYDEKKIKSYLQRLDKRIRKLDKRISQVGLRLIVTDKLINVVNHTGINKTEERHSTLMYVNAIFKDGDKSSNSSFSFGECKGLELLDKNIDKEIETMLKYGLDKLYAGNCVGKEMPVILGPGFGAVIFHEACGHAMEAEAIATNASVLCGKIGEKIASDKVTIIDDGTIDGLWGTTQIDDEGNSTQRNVLIKDGVLVNYLNDELNNRKLNMGLTGSSRRENYKYAPVSRMNNTYLQPMDDTIEDMIKSIDFGLYAIELGGGQVDPETGDFNFSCKTAYMVRDGKIAECVKGASLIGNTLSILNNVEMVSDDLKYDVGFCGASSGSVPVTTGEPTIKVSKILVGGEDSDN